MTALARKIERTGTPEINVQKLMAFSKAKEMLLWASKDGRIETWIYISITTLHKYCRGSVDEEAFIN
jgi:hypothetical protein